MIPRVDKVTVDHLLDTLKADYQANGRRSLDRLNISLGHLRPAFGSRRAIHVTSADITAYATTRQAAGAANGTINRELAALKRAYSLALDAERLHRAPRMRMLREDNVRQGFFRPAAVRGRPEPARAGASQPRHGRLHHRVARAE